MISKVLIIIIANVVLLIRETQSTDTLRFSCSPASIRKVDTLVAKVVTLGNTGRKFPESAGQELIAYCNETVRLLNQVDFYKNHCMKNLTKQVFSVLIFSTINGIKPLCKSPETIASMTAQKLILSAPCANKANHQLNKCYTNFIDAILGAQNAQSNLRIPYVCCEYFKMFPCMQERGRQIAICANTHINTIIEFVRSLNDNVIDLTCGDYTENSDKCEKLGSPPKKRKDQRRTKSFMIPLSHLFASLDE